MTEQNGRYCWTYTMDMKNNRSIYKLVVRIVCSCIVLVFTGVTLMSGFGRGSLEPMGDMLKVLIPVGIAVYLICRFAYWLVSKAYGGKYIMHYVMDERGITFSQTDEELQMTEMIGTLAAASGSPSVPAVQDVHSRFDKVRYIRTVRRDDLIYVWSLFKLNMIYAEGKDYDFVLAYITSHCPAARAGRTG